MTCPPPARGVPEPPPKPLLPPPPGAGAAGVAGVVGAVGAVGTPPVIQSGSLKAAILAARSLKYLVTSRIASVTTPQPLARSSVAGNRLSLMYPHSSLKAG